MLAASVYVHRRRPFALSQDGNAPAMRRRRAERALSSASRPAAMLGCAAALALSARLFVWPRADEPAPADAVVALDGDRPRRLVFALTLMERRLAPTLVAVRGETVSPALFERDLPYELVSFVPEPSTTRGEALAVARLAAERGWRRIVVVTSTYHLTRARLIFERALACELRFVPAGYSRRRLPRDIPSEWARLALALLVRRAPLPLEHQPREPAEQA
jgi:uncharacterized SAM-binding protein YcdF (DUF218 family)